MSSINEIENYQNNFFVKHLKKLSENIFKNVNEIIKVDIFNYLLSMYMCLHYEDSVSLRYYVKKIDFKFMNIPESWVEAINIRRKHAGDIHPMLESTNEVRLLLKSIDINTLLILMRHIDKPKFKRIFSINSSDYNYGINGKHINFDDVKIKTLKIPQEFIKINLHKNYLEDYYENLNYFNDKPSIDVNPILAEILEIVNIIEIEKSDASIMTLYEKLFMKEISLMTS